MACSEGLAVLETKCITYLLHMNNASDNSTIFGIVSSSNMVEGSSTKCKEKLLNGCVSSVFLLNVSVNAHHCICANVCCCLVVCLSWSGHLHAILEDKMWTHSCRFVEQGGAGISLCLCKVFSLQSNFYFVAICSMESYLHNVFKKSSWTYKVVQLCRSRWFGPDCL